MGVILIAFERESEQSALEQLLARRGHRVVRSANGLAALDAARREPPHAVVSDIVLPRMDGFALCRKWKQDERLQAIPFLFYTRRHDDPKYERFALELGAERFLVRSQPPEALLTALDELLGAAVPEPEPTRRMPALDEAAAAQRAAAIERAQQLQAQAMEKALVAQTTQARMQAQIEELEAINERLGAGEARFRRVFEANPLPMWIADRATGGFIAVNDAALALHGYTRAEFLALAQAALSASSADASSGSRTHRRKDGATIALSVSSIEIEFDGRSADLVSAYDLTARIATHERQLREAVEQAIREAEQAARKAAEEATLLAVQRAAEDARKAAHESAEKSAQEAAQKVEQISGELLAQRGEHAQTLRSLQRADVALQSMIDSLVRMSERHDPYTSGSARRVAALAVALGREAGLDGERQHALRVAALLHDIGNVAVPASILSKPAPLTEAELALMRTHVEEGCQLLAEIDFGAPVAEIVYQSHERHDGSGYPRGLKSEEILPEARILAISDTVEAMCSARPYRPAAGMDAAIDEINRGAGRLYDPQLVAACTRLVRQHGFTLPE